MFLMMISTILSSALGFIGLVFMTRYLGLNDFGEIAWALATLTALNSFFDLGFGSAHVKRISEGRDLGDCISTYARIKLILTSLMVIVTIIWIIIWINLLGGSLSSSAWNIFLLFLLCIVLSDLSTIATHTFIALQETAKTQLVVLIDPLIRVPLVIFALVSGMATNGVLIAYSIAAFAAFIVSMTLLFKERIDWHRPTLFRSYLKFAIPLATLPAIAAVSANIDKITLGSFVSNEAVACFSSPQTLLAVVIGIGTSITLLAFPQFSKMYVDANIEGIREVTKQLERHITMIVIPIVTLVVFLPTEVCVAIFGAAFSPAGNAMRFLGIAVIPTMLNTVCASQIIAANRPYISVELSVLALIINTIMMLVFIPSSLFGIQMLGLSFTGAAIANMISVFVLFIAIRIVIWRLTRTALNKRILLHIASGIITGVFILELNTAYPLVGISSLFIFGIFTLIVYCIVMIVFRELRKEDIAFLLDMMNIRKMNKYMIGR